VVASLLVVTRSNAIHALLYLIVSLLGAAVVFSTLGAPFAAALEVILYAGAIMVLFVFVLMMLDLRGGAIARERSWLEERIWGGPTVLAAILLGQLLWSFQAAPASANGTVVGAIEVGTALYGPYILGVELAGFLLLGALVGAFHIGRRERVVGTTPRTRRFGAEDGAGERRAR